MGFARKAGLQAPTAVPFRGGGDIVINVVSGNLDFGMLNYAEAESQIKAGDVRPLMVLTPQRMKILPDVPTAKELGIDADYSTVRGFVTLKGVPEDRLKILEDGLIKAMQGQMYTTYIETSGQAPDSVAPACGMAGAARRHVHGRRKRAESAGRDQVAVRRNGRGGGGGGALRPAPSPSRSPIAFDHHARGDDERDGRGGSFRAWSSASSRCSPCCMHSASAIRRWKHPRRSRRCVWITAAVLVAFVAAVELVGMWLAAIRLPGRPRAALGREAAT